MKVASKSCKAIDSHTFTPTSRPCTMLYTATVANKPAHAIEHVYNKSISKQNGFLLQTFSPFFPPPLLSTAPRSNERGAVVFPPFDKADFQRTIAQTCLK
ncbi:MAG: hypothetical protein KC423_17320 [Anaerolineales bacterium]|nr:hypothetical protein [Anaerolineales bacterium]